MFICTVTSVYIQANTVHVVISYGENTTTVIGTVATITNHNHRHRHRYHHQSPSSQHDYDAGHMSIRNSLIINAIQPRSPPIPVQSRIRKDMKTKSHATVIVYSSSPCALCSRACRRCCHRLALDVLDPVEPRR